MGAKSGVGTLRLPTWLTRRLGVRPGIDLEITASPVAGRAASETRLPGRDLRLVGGSAVESTTGSSKPVDLLVFPLDLRVTTTRPTEGLGRWEREWTDLCGLAAPDVGLARLSSAGQAPPTPPVLPPVFHCSEKRVWVAAVCPECTGPGPQAAPGERCWQCGSPRVGSAASSPGTPVDPLRALWRRVREGGAATTAGTEEGGDDRIVPCVACDRKDTCFPAAGPSTAPGTAGAFLTPLVARPWSAAMIEPVHVPLAAWARLASGATWASVRAGLEPSVPASRLDAAEARLGSGSRFWTGPEFGAAFAWEMLLVRAEMLRQLLVGLRGLAQDQGHPHLGLRPETVWVALDPPRAGGTLLGEGRLAILEAAPGWTPPRSPSGPTRFEPPADRPAALTPPGCGPTERWVEAIGMPGGPAAASDPRTGAKIKLVLSEAMKSTPARGDIVRLMAAAGPPDAEPASARVEIAFPEVCSLVVDEPQNAPEWIRGLLEQKQRGLPLRMGMLRDHSPVDDLFAAGTIWLGLFLPDPGDMVSAARFRTRLTEVLRESKLVHGTGPGGKRLVETAVGAGAAGPWKEAAAGPASEGFGAALELGLRLCGAYPAGFAGQGHEPTTLASKRAALDGFIEEVRSLADRARHALVGVTTGDLEILRAMDAYVAERRSPPEGADR